MTRIARSAEPLYQTRGRPVGFPVTISNPDGSACDLTGASASARLAWAGACRTLAVLDTLNATGRFTMTGAASLTTDLPLGRIAELSMTLTDSLGNVTDYVWPVIGEIP